MNKLHYYELDFNGYGEEEKETEDSYLFCIKTEIENITNEQALQLLQGYDKADVLTRVIEIPEDEAEAFYDVSDLTIKKECEFGVYYGRVFNTGCLTV